jgi:hypothetical protein
MICFKADRDVYKRWDAGIDPAGGYEVAEECAMTTAASGIIPMALRDDGPCSTRAVSTARS